nr:ribonuclease H-like domain-containing protein [Tanacetum cinerariifolium]
VGISHETFVARSPQQNGVVERCNRTLIEAARTMTAHNDYLKHTQEETANLREIVENERLLNPLNTSLDYACKSDGKVDEGFLVGYSVSKNKPNVACSGPTWLFDIDTLTKTMNYQPVTSSNQSNPSVGVQEQFDVEKAAKDNVQQYVNFLLWSSGSTNPPYTDGDATFRGKEIEFEGRKPESKVYVSLSSSAQTKKHDDKTKKEAKGKSLVESST